MLLLVPTLVRYVLVSEGWFSTEMEELSSISVVNCLINDGIKSEIRMIVSLIRLAKPKCDWPAGLSDGLCVCSFVHPYVTHILKLSKRLTKNGWKWLWT